VIQRERIVRRGRHRLLARTWQRWREPTEFTGEYEGSFGWRSRGPGGARERSYGEDRPGTGLVRAEEKRQGERAADRPCSSAVVEVCARRRSPGRRPHARIIGDGVAFRAGRRSGSQEVGVGV
jgi:hypothetical protein